MVHTCHSPYFHEMIRFVSSETSSIGQAFQLGSGVRKEILCFVRHATNPLRNPGYLVLPHGLGGLRLIMLTFPKLLIASFWGY